MGSVSETSESWIGSELSVVSLEISAGIDSSGILSLARGE